MSLGYRPIVYMWVAEYRDGSAIPQFDPDTGRETPFSSINQFRLCKFGWYPFSIGMMGKIFKADGIAVIPTNNPFYSIELLEGQVLVAKRTTEMAMFRYRSCGICGHHWQQKKSAPSEMIGLPTSNEFYVENIKAGDRVVKFSSPICPNCGYHDTNAVMMADKKIKRYGSEVRRTFYVLGIEGGEVKRIGEDGKVVN